MMRSVSFVDRLEFEFSGNHFSQALSLGDVDGDRVREREGGREREGERERE